MESDVKKTENKVEEAADVLAHLLVSLVDENLNINLNHNNYGKEKKVLR